MSLRLLNRGWKTTYRQDMLVKGAETSGGLAVVEITAIRLVIAEDYDDN